jgi:TIGR03009 family protein
MRHLSPTLAALLLAVSPLAAQTTPAPPPPKNDKVPLPNPELVDLLKAWERKMTAIDRLETKCSRVEIEAIRGKKQEFVGKAKFLKPNMAILELSNVEKPQEDREYYISNGNHLYEFQFRNKVVRVHDLPKGGGISDDTFLAFLFGMKAEDALKRYVLQAWSKPSQPFIYIRVLPTLPADKQEFTEAQLVFWSPKAADFDRAWADWALLPVRLWFKNPNDNQVTWTFSEPNLRVKVEKADFVAPSLKDLPKEWRIEKADAGPAADPRRPQSNYTVPNPDVPPSKVRQ